MSSNSLENRIISTLCYFKYFNQPVTLVELQRWLLNGGNFGDQAKGIAIKEIKMALEEPFLNGKVEFKDGFIFLKQATVGVSVERILQRNKKYRISEFKRRQARVALALWKRIPYVRAIALVNTVGAGIARELSDTDFFVIAEPGHIFTVRFFMAGIAALFGWRPTENKKDGTCLSFYLSRNFTDIKKLSSREDDIYLAFWFLQALPIYDCCGAFKNLAKQNIDWANNFFTSNPVNMWCSARTKTKKPVCTSIFEGIINLFGGLLENISKYLQQKKLNKIKTFHLQSIKNATVWNDDVIKLHWNDAREQIYSIWKQELAKH